MININKQTANCFRSFNDVVVVVVLCFFLCVFFFFLRDEHLCVCEGLGWASDFGQR